MNMFRHKDKCVQFIAAFATIPIYRLQEEASVRLDNKQSPALPGRERHKVSSRRGDESSRLQRETSAAGSRGFTQTKSARVELVPFPVISLTEFFVLGKADVPRASRKARGFQGGVMHCSCGLS